MVGIINLLVYIVIIIAIVDGVIIMIKRNRENNYWEEMEVYDKWHEGSNEQTYAEYGPQEDFEGDNGEDNIDY